MIGEEGLGRFQAAFYAKTRRVWNLLWTKEGGVQRSE